MRDLLVIVPSRGRPVQAAELYETLAATCTTRTDVFLAWDDDDPAAGGYQELTCGDRLPSAGGECRLWTTSGPRQGLGAWTNQVAAEQAGHYRALASLGDDHRPRTRGWDERLLAALDEHGGTGIAYGNDLLMGERLPTAAVISSDIVTALGWMCLPSLRHYFVDNVWSVLGSSAGCLRYLPDVIIEHLHPLATWEVPDATYREAQAGYEADHAAFQEWMRDAAVADVAAVRNLMTATEHA